MIVLRFPRPALIPLHTNNNRNPRYNDMKLNQQLYYIPTFTIANSVDRSGYNSQDKSNAHLRNLSAALHNLQLRAAANRKSNNEKRKRRNNKTELVQLHNNKVLSSSSVVEDLYSNEDENPFAFHRTMHCDYHEPIREASGKWPYNKMNRLDHSYNLTSIRNPR